MSPKTLISQLMVLGIAVGIVLVSYYQFFAPFENPAIYQTSAYGWKIPEAALPGGSVTGADAFSALRGAGPAKGLPVRLVVPAIGVNSAIEDAYITPDGRMDVPAGSVNVAWYAAGTIPGETGSAVIGGHYGIDRGVPKVFYRLNQLTPGQKVYTINDRQEVSAFVIDRIKVYARNDNSADVFLSSDGKAHLNLITCEGEWNQADGTYKDRRVVFATSVPYSNELKATTTVAPTRRTTPRVTPTATVTNVPTRTPTVTVSPTLSPIPTPAPMRETFLDRIIRFLGL